MYKTGSRGKAGPVTEEQYKTLFKSLYADQRHGPRNAPMLALSFECGLRAVEIANIKLNEILDLNGDPYQDGFKIHYTKGGKAREVYPTPRVIEALTEYLKVRGGKHNYLHSHLFITQKATAFSANTIAQLFLRIYNEAGIKASSHSGRRYFATKLLREGIDLETVASMGGWNSLQMIKEYANDNPIEKRRVASTVFN